MTQCLKCKQNIPNRILCDGKMRVLNKRKYCLDCSPFNEHNTKKLNGSLRKDQEEDTVKYKCSCGETDKSKFYGNKGKICAKCHNTYTLNTGRVKRLKAIEYKGNKCVLCGYNRYEGALEFHHINPHEKDPQFCSLRSWSWARIKKEIDKCVLICSCCHREVHAGVTSLPT